MPRKTFAEEQKARQIIEKLIDTEALMSNFKTFYPPSYVVGVLEGYGVFVSRDYVVDRYNEIGIRNENGLWIQKQ